MAILQPAFDILLISGCWMLPSSRTIYSKTVYTLYTGFVLLLLHTFCISQFFNVILNVRTADELSENFYMFIASVLSCCKIISLLINRQRIKILVEKLEEEPCKPLNNEEIRIQKKFDKSIGSVTIYYIVLVESTVLCMILSSLFTDFPVRKLAYRAWLPFNCSVPTYYYIAYSHQIVALIGTALLNVACDVIICGFFVHVCGRQAILKHRLKGIPQQRNPKIGEIVRFHDFLYGYTATLQQEFRGIIAIQLCSSTMVVCFILYKLSNTSPTSLNYLQFVLYLACMMSQIFVYCWYGNELKLKSLDLVNVIFEIDWFYLDNNTKKDLIIIMRRAMKPTELAWAQTFTMDLNTYMGILKLSYSAYNFLQRTKES